MFNGTRVIFISSATKAVYFCHRYQKDLTDNSQPYTKTDISGLTGHSNTCHFNILKNFDHLGNGTAKSGPS